MNEGDGRRGVPLPMEPAVDPGSRAPRAPGAVAPHRDVVETAPDGFWMVDVAGRLLDVNDAYVRQSGYSREELLRMRIADLEARESPEDVASRIAALCRDGTHRFETRHRRKSGEVWPVEVATTYWPSEGGRIYAFLRDLRSRSRSEELLAVRLRLSELSVSGSLDDVLQAALDEAERLTGSRIGFFHFVEDDQVTLSLQTWSTNTLRGMCTAEGKGTHYPLDRAGVWADCVRRREPVIHNDYASLADRQGLPAGHAPVVRELTVPVLRGSVPRAIIGVGNKESDYVAEDVAVLTELARLATDVIERKRAEYALRESEHRYHRLVESSPDAIIVHDGERVLLANPAALRMFGAREERDVLGTPILERIHPESRPGVRERQSLILQGEPVPIVEDTLVRLDGSTFLAEMTGAAVTVDGRSAVLIVGRDTTERRRIDAELRQQRENFEKVFAAAPVGLLLVDEDRMIRKANRSVSDLVRRTPESLVGLRPGVALGCQNAFADPRGCGFSGACPACPLRLGIEAVLAGEGPAPRGEIEIERAGHAGPERRFLHVHVEGVELDGRRYAIPALEDVTERTASERAVRESEKALRDAQALARVGNFSYDVASDRWSSSPELDRIFGIDESWERSLAGWSRLVHPSMREDLEIYFRRFVLEEGRFDREYRIVRPADGSESWVHGLGLVERDAEGRPARLVGTIQDVTERKRDDERLRQAALVFSSSREGFVITDRDANVLAVNEAFTRITGYTESEALGRNLRFLASGRHDVAFYRAMWHELLWTGYWQGEVWNKRKDGTLYPEWLSITAIRDDSGHITGFVGVFSDMTKVKATEERLQHLVMHDALTDLPNRLHVASRIEHAIARSRQAGRSCAVLAANLRRFKVVNESLGHAAGDELLQMAAQRLRAVVRGTDTVARASGDEFVVLVEDLEQPELVAGLARTLAEAFEKPFPLARGRRARVGLRIGIAVFPGDGADAADLLRSAEAALASARELPHGFAAYHSEAMSVAAREQLELEADLHRALGSGELDVHYQPVVSLRTGRPVSVEALARWHRPGHGLVPPATFVPVAERTGLFAHLGDTVLRQACRQMKAWLDLGFAIDRLIVNLSPHQLAIEDLPLRVASIVRESGLAPDHLELDVTESAVPRLGSGADASLRALKRLGVHVAIDDFGTGSSSLASLRSLPVDAIKIDGSFIRSLPEDRSQREIVLMMISLARQLGLDVVAEGVENGEQAKFLTWSDCTLAQGYHFGRPAPPDEVAALLAGR